MHQTVVTHSKSQLTTHSTMSGYSTMSDFYLSFGLWSAIGETSAFGRSIIVNVSGYNADTDCQRCYVR